LVIAAFAMSLLEIARLVAENLGVGLLPITPVALFIAMITIWKERKMRTRTMGSVSCDSFDMFLFDGADQCCVLDSCCVLVVPYCCGDCQECKTALARREGSNDDGKFEISKLRPVFG